MNSKPSLDDLRDCIGQ